MEGLLNRIDALNLPRGELGRDEDGETVRLFQVKAGLLTLLLRLQLCRFCRCNAGHGRTNVLTGGSQRFLDFWHRRPQSLKNGAHMRIC